MQKKKKKEKKKKWKWSEFKSDGRVILNNPQGSKFEPLLSFPSWAKNLNLHYKPSKSPLWSIEVVHVNYVRLDPF